MNVFFRIFIIFTFLFAASCSTNKAVHVHETEDDMGEYTFEPIDIFPETELDTLPKVYRGSATMHFDILHTKLDLRFDWNKSNVLGKADLTIKPYFNPIDIVYLDAVGFDIHAVTLGNGKPLAYRYDGKELVINLDKTYSRKDTFDIKIDYTAKPDENLISGSDVITSNKGLFFINPLGKDPDVPSQIWTQGETENNSRWFPTFDKPNERFTQEIILTVDNKCETLSNGRLISTKVNPDGTRTDYWKQDMAHAPYLAMIAVGDFHVEHDTWNGIPLTYMVDKEYGKYAKQIFNHTPEMLTFFSNILDYPFPWDKYSQVVVREFVSGAMENTGAVVFGDFVQKTDRELIEEPNDDIVAHEMFHHWFGDLVTCEDWSNLTLNEGFASYAEYLWTEYKYGYDHAEFSRLMSTYQYLQEVYYGKKRPLIHYYYNDRESMFDRHSYNKGALVLHMLRKYVGDEAFFVSLNRYLTQHAGTAVEIDELRMAFEDTIGEDLHWFFDQWYLGQGHPHIHVSYDFDAQQNALTVKTDQSETPDHFSYPFTLPVVITVFYEDGNISYHPVTITEEKQSFRIDNLQGKPANYILDGQSSLLAIITETKDEAQFLHQFNQAPHFLDKLEAIKNIEHTEKIIPALLKDTFHFFRLTGIEYVPENQMSDYSNQLQDMAISDSDPKVRRSAYIRLLDYEDYDPMLLTHIIINSEKSYQIIEIALSVLGAYESESFSKYFDKFKNEDSDYLVSTLVSLIPDEDEIYLDYLDKKAVSINIKYINDFYHTYFEYIQSKGLNVLERAYQTNASIANPTNGSVSRKVYAMNTLVRISAELMNRSNDNQAQVLLDNILAKIKEIAHKETDPELLELAIYKDFRE